MDFELRHLRQARTLAEHRSFAKGASALGISQPALSRSMQELEHRLGMTLFIRRRDGVSPTDAGRVLLKRAEDLLAQAGDLSRHMQLLRGLEIGTLRIGAGIYPSEMFVGPAVARMVREHPGVAIEVRTRNPDEHFAALRRHEIDLAVVDGPWAQSQRDLDVTLMSWHHGRWGLRADHPLRGLRNSALRDVLRFPVAISARVPPEIISKLHQGAAPGESVRLLGCDSPSMIKLVVAQSDAIGVLPYSVMAREIADGTLAALPLDTAWLGREFGIARVRGRAESEAEKVFARYVIDADRAAVQLDAQIERAQIERPQVARSAPTPEPKPTPPRRAKPRGK